MTPSPNPAERPREDDRIGPARSSPRRSPDAAAERAPVITQGVLPARIARRYHAQPARFGRYIDYYEGSGAKRPAFRDRGDQLAALQADPATITAMLDIARHRGWTRIETRGDDVFRREVWMQAQRLGLEVTGYRPKARDREEVEKARAGGDRQARHAGPRRSAPDPGGPQLAERFRRASPAEARRDPDLSAAQARLAVVEAVARGRLRDPIDQASVQAAAKARIAAHLEQGRTFSAPEIVGPARRPARTRDPSDAPERGPERQRGR